MKTPEEMAEEYANSNGSGNETYEHGLLTGFLAGYEAAQQLVHELQQRLKEANDTIDGLSDECEGLKTIIYDDKDYDGAAIDTNSSDRGTKMNWKLLAQSTPEDGDYCLVAADEYPDIITAVWVCDDTGIYFRHETFDEKIHRIHPFDFTLYWMLAPKLPTISST